ncbi:hypothetical protein K491DRAFT_715227 [Lophiostoma macrostomum CBS 122681]|uniref:F-box domain-containing protein n=1 Tax=Lophiostoma macrostomum CBS 122681 TaxID=1314788 RepID=A0A6A6TA06_9PLEO|nr:hypothetical protein K491DRAFT_715227 [Lophiostoma macrostomum CBS 122681]
MGSFLSTLGTKLGSILSSQPLPSPINDVPDEILAMILGDPDLSFFDVFRCRLVCQKWKNFIENAQRGSELRKRIFKMEKGDLYFSKSNIRHRLAFTFRVHSVNGIQVVVRDHSVTVPGNTSTPQPNNPPTQGFVFHPLIADLPRYMDFFNPHFVTTGPDPVMAATTDIDMGRLTARNWGLLGRLTGMNRGLPPYWARPNAAELDMLVKLGDTRPYRFSHYCARMFVSSPAIRYLDVEVYVEDSSTNPTLLRSVSFNHPRRGVLLGHINVFFGQCFRDLRQHLPEYVQREGNRNTAAVAIHRI